MAGEIIRQGDSTSHGGTVLEGSMTDICHGKPIAYIGHKVSCPKCKGTYPIVEGVPTTTFYGQGVALAGMKTACGAVLIATQFTDTVKFAGGGQSSSASSPAAAAAVIAIAAQVGLPQAGEPGEKVKKVTAISWSYGKDEQPVSGFSRFYVDLNLHVETENYAAGEMVDITIENDDGGDVVDGVKKLSLRAAVGADGKATLMNALAGKTVNTVAQTEAA
jgi:uncharacterized Zn-binding protein involved in type VI secretion